MTTTPERAQATREREAIFEAALEFIRSITGLAPLAMETAPPDVLDAFYAFADKVQAATAAARQSAPESCKKVDDCTESLCMQANRCKHTLTPQPQRLCVEQSAPEAARTGVVIDAYAIPVEDYRTEIKIQRMRQIEGPALWKVARNGDCLNKSGEWEYEPMPSSRDDEFLARCRFDSPEEAIAAAMKA